MTNAISAGSNPTANNPRQPMTVPNEALSAAAQQRTQR